MKGLIVWAQSNCRSTMALYRALIAQLHVPAVVTLWHYSDSSHTKDIREQIGFSHEEFADVPMIPVGENLSRGLRLMNEHPGWSHLFCVWQGSPVYRQFIQEAHRRGEKVGIMCESPCNMESGARRVLKGAYMRLVLPFLARSVIRSSEFFVNYSGDDDTAARRLGWPQEKIIPFGYYPPPIPGSRMVCRSHGDLKVLVTGVLSRYRGADLIVEALRKLKDMGVAYHAIITQSGPLLAELKAKARHFSLPIEFPGFVSMERLVQLYESCSVYVAAGRSEPWGMRLNDALNCGAPLVVSEGMGGAKLVRDYDCGRVFKNGDVDSLVSILRSLSQNGIIYSQCAGRAIDAARQCAPECKAKELLERIVGKL